MTFCLRRDISAGISVIPAYPSVGPTSGPTPITIGILRKPLSGGLCIILCVLHPWGLCATLRAARAAGNPSPRGLGEVPVGQYPLIAKQNRRFAPGKVISGKSPLESNQPTGIPMGFVFNRPDGLSRPLSKLFFLDLLTSSSLLHSSLYHYPQRSFITFEVYLTFYCFPAASSMFVDLHIKVDLSVHIDSES